MAVTRPGALNGSGCGVGSHWVVVSLIPLGSNWSTGVAPAASDAVGLGVGVAEAGPVVAPPGGTVRVAPWVGSTPVPPAAVGVGVVFDGDDAAATTAITTMMATAPPTMPPMSSP